MKKLITIIIVAGLALTIQAQDVTNTLGADGNFFVNKTGGTPSYLTLSSTGDHIMQFSAATSGFQIRNSAGATIFNLNDIADVTAFATFIVGADAGNNWDDGNFAHLQMQQSFALYGTASNELKMIGRGAHNFITGMYSNESGSTATDVVDGNTLLSIRGEGFFNTSYRKAAYIVMGVDGTPNGNLVPGKIIFGTGTNAAGPAERMTIKSDGKVGIGTESPNSTLNVNGSLALPLTLAFSSRTLNESEYTIIANDPNGGDITLTLPDSNGIEGRIYVIKKVNNTTGVTIDAGSGHTIDEFQTISLNTGYQYIIVQASGPTHWVIIGGN